MITEDLIRQQFIHETVSAGLKKIFQTQQQVVTENYQVITGSLLSHLVSMPFDASFTGVDHIYYVRILPYLRFLDMAYRLRNDRVAKAKRAKIAVYNRVVWGVLYHETFPQIMYGLNDEIRNGIRKELESSLNQKDNG